jgi:hypothetical protein
MARSRSFPSQLLDDPDYFDLKGDTQAILVGLVLCADDHGRGMAHTSWLARKLNREASVIETALAELESHHMLTLYQVEQQRYYWLLKWWEWQKLHNPARPLYPEPPKPSEGTDQTSPRTFSEKVRETSRDSENLRKSSREEEEEEEEERESEIEREGEDEEESPPENVVTFPIPLRDDSSDGGQENKEEQGLLQQIARILRLAPDEALLRIVQDYRAVSGLSLLGEADAAREWMDDPQRNKRRKKMTPAFFRSWLKRECESRTPGQEAVTASPYQHPKVRAAPPVHPNVRSRLPSGTGPASHSLMDLEQRYKQQVKGG